VNLEELGSRFRLKQSTIASFAHSPVNEKSQRPWLSPHRSSTVAEGSPIYVDMIFG
jgi:hypothetical protein